ncbi:MAG: PAS domain S-box protein [Kofleriaceae bacterium]|nr:PAS domain S-box protein [Kofleriaceae bacterium]
MNKPITGLRAVFSQLPLKVAGVLVFICLLPTLLQLLGADFSSAPPVSPADFDELDGKAFRELAFSGMSGSFTHTILEWTATIIALFTIVLAFAHFIVRRDIVTPVVAFALLAAGTMDAFHTLAADRLISASANNQDLIPFTWAICRTFNAIIPLTALLMLFFMRRWSVEAAPRRSVWVVAGFALLLAILSALIIDYAATSAALPQTMFPDATITRPWDVYPLVIYAFSGFLLYPLFLRKVTNYFALALWLSVIPDVATQLHMALGSTALFDHHFNVAHFMKIIAYAVPCLGLIADYVRTYRQVEVEVEERKLAQNMVEQHVAIVQEKSAELAASEARVQAIIDTAFDMIIVIDKKGIVESVNPSVKREFGYEPSEVIGQNIKMLMPNPYQEEHDGYLAAYHDTGVAKAIGKSRDVSARRKDGTVFPVSLSVGEMQLDSECMFVGILQNVSKQKAAEREKTEMLVDLQRSNADLEKFAYVASHDLQEPLRMIASYTWLLKEDYGGKLGEEADEYIDFAVDGAKRMQALIQELLTYSKIGQSSIELRETDSQEIAEQVQLDLKIMIAEAGAEVVAKGLPRITADPIQLRQLLQNLVSNGIKFSKSETPRVTVSAKRDGNRWMFSISDNGIGFDMQYKDRIFEIFQRLHTRTEYAGSGMGLAICDRIVHRHGGQIEVQSELGKGTTFSFSMAVDDNTD